MHNFLIISYATGFMDPKIYNSCYTTYVVHYKALGYTVRYNIICIVIHLPYKCHLLLSWYWDLSALMSCFSLLDEELYERSFFKIHVKVKRWRMEMQIERQKKKKGDIRFREKIHRAFEQTHDLCRLLVNMYLPQQERPHNLKISLA